MAKKSSIAKAVLITLLVLPSVLYFIFVYGAEGNFFVTLDYVGPKTVVEKEVEGELVSDTLYYKIPPFQFTTQDNELLSSEDMLGKIYVANFFFSTCPTVCPAMNYNLQQVQDRFIGYEYIDFLSFTVDPEHDTVEVLKAYEQKIGAVNGRWFFLTGEKEEIYKTAANFFLSAQVDEDAPGGFLHSENLVLVDWEGRIRSRKDEQGNLKAVYSGTSPVEINELKDDIKVLIAEYEKTKSVNEYRESKEKKVMAKVRELKTENRSSDKIAIPIIILLSVLVPIAVALLILFPETFKLETGINRGTLPAFHAILNGSTAILLLMGLFFIMKKNLVAHRFSMLTAFGLSAVFLVSYVISKLNADPIPYGGEGALRSLYFFILISHILLSVPVLPLAMLSIYRGLTQEYAKHRKLVRYTFPIWLYVAVTGVLVYLFMQPYY